MEGITKRSEKQFRYITQMLSSITEGKRKYTKPNKAARKRARTSVESPQQPGPSRAGASAVFTTTTGKTKGQNVS